MKRQWRIPEQHQAEHSKKDKFDFIQDISVSEPINTLSYSLVMSNPKQHSQEYLEYLIAKLKLIKAEFPAVIDANIKFLEDVISYNNTAKSNVYKKEFQEYLETLDDKKQIRFNYKVKTTGETRFLVDTERGFQAYNFRQGDNLVILSREAP